MKKTKTTKRKGASAKKSKGLDFSVKNLKQNSMNLAATTGGFMGAHAITKVVPLSNEKLKKAIPLVLGVAASASGNRSISSAGAGMVAYGVVSVAREFLGLGAAPISGISDNETVQKIANLLLPSLGNSDGYALVYGANDGYPSFEPVEDVNYVELNGAFDENPFLAGSFESDVNPFANQLEY
jgi:hypothetical protein